MAARVAAFFDGLASVPVIQLPLRTLAASDPGRHRRIRDDADLRIVELGLDTELRDARRAIGVWLQGKIGGHETHPIGDAMFGSMLQLSVDDRVRIERGLDDALLAVMLGDQLGDDDSTELLGGWDDLVPRRR